MRDPVWRRSWSGADVSSSLSSRRRSCRTSSRRRRPAQRVAGGQRTLRGLLRGLGELHGPRSLLAGIDFEKLGAIETARQTIIRAANREFLFTRAHEGLPGPFAAAVVIDRIDVIIPSDERAA